MEQIIEYRIIYRHAGYEESSERYYQAHTVKEALSNFEACHIDDDVAIDGVYAYDRFREQWLPATESEDELKTKE